MSTDETQNNTQNAEHADAPAPAQVSTLAQRPQPRSWSIVWGVLVLVVCVYSTAQLVSPGSVDPTAWIVATTIGLGGLLLAVGIAVLLRGRR